MRDEKVKTSQLSSLIGTNSSLINSLLIPHPLMRIIPEIAPLKKAISQQM